MCFFAVIDTDKMVFITRVASPSYQVTHGVTHMKVNVALWCRLEFF